MKVNRSLSLILLLALLLGLALPVTAAPSQSITVDPINVMVGGKVFLPTDVNGKNVPIFVYDGTTYAPLRALAEAYGLTVGYNAKKNLATVDGKPSAAFAGSKGTAQALTKRTTLSVSSINIEVNGSVFQPKDANGKAVSVFVYDGTTYAPLRALAEAYGLAVSYDSVQNLATVEFVTPAIDVTPKLSKAVQPLKLSRKAPMPDAVGSIEPYSDHWMRETLFINEDLSAAPELAYSLTFSDKTTFSALPAGYDPEALLEWGKAPGLNVDILHKHGFTGEGAVIAYVDQPAPMHEQYNNLNLHYQNNADSRDSMHGPAVLSLLAGKDTGTAPEAEVYYYAHAAWFADQATHAECLYQIIEQNKALPADKKITMVGFSDNIDPSEANTEAFEAAAKACEDAGIMVWFCAENGGVSFLPMSDKNNYRNLVVEHWGGGLPDTVYVPSSGRTTAATEFGNRYIYWASGGLSWSMPYILGLYAIAVEIDPTLTQDDLRTLVVDTAYDHNGIPIVNPVGFVAAVLENVGRGSEAKAMLDEVSARQKYLYAVMDTAAMSKEDLQATADYLSEVTEATVLVCDASSFSSADQLYTELQADAAARGGQITGVQIFGTAGMVPAFNVRFKVDMVNAVDEAGFFLTDLFYGNFNNDAKVIANDYSIMDHFAEGWDVDLVPQWPVVRLPLERGEYAAFFEKYEAFVTASGQKQQRIVNFSNPIFQQKNHTDDMGAFLNRMNREFGLLDVEYRLYGNLEGDVPVLTAVLGGFTKENLAAENDTGIMELIINSHGQWDNIDQCYYVAGQEQRRSFLNMLDINTVLDGSAYYLDCWTCNNGSDMQNNLTTTALNGKCVGMFSATAVISNNGVNCNASVEKMRQSNFYYFYYSYLKALHEGASRSQAFCAAQQAYATALVADSASGIRPGEGNYQFNVHNLLAYHNFGVIEPVAAAVAASDANGYIAQAGHSVPKETAKPTGSGPSANRMPALTDGTPVGEAKTLKWGTNDQLTNGSCTIHSYTAQKLDNGYIRFTIEYTATKDLSPAMFNPPNGDQFMLLGTATSGERESQSFDVKEELVRATQEITVNFSGGEKNRFFVFVSTSGL